MCSEARVIAKVLDWLGFGSRGHGHGEHDHHHHGDDYARGHTHGVVDPTIATTERGIWAIKWSFLILAGTAVVQLIVVFVSHSVALLADTIHNIADAGTAIPLWVAFALARRKATETFTYGYGRVEDFAGLIIVLIILSSALVAGYEAIDRIIHPRQVIQLGWLAAAGVIGFLGNEAVAVFRIRVGRQINSAALIADGYHARTDGLTSLAVVLGAFGVWLGYTLADPIIGLIITAVILGIVWQSAKAVLTRMLDGVERPTIGELRHAAQHARGVLGVESVRARWLGHRLQAEMRLAVDPTLSLADARKVAHDIEEHARGHLPALERLLVETVPASGGQRSEGHPQAKHQHHH
jgi:cation diffusion facilitator family transporter